MTMAFFLPVQAIGQTSGDILSGKKVFYIEDFETTNIGDLPKNWYNQRGNGIPATYNDEDRASYKYKVEGDSTNKYLAYEGIRGKHLNFPLINKDSVDIHQTPYLSWKWRIHQIPEGANENDDDKNDTAASIYVVFDFGRVLMKKVPKSIRYTWSSTLPKGTVLSKFYGNQKILVLGSGEEGLGEWHTFERNIVNDYKMLYGDNPPSKPIAILILSDGNSTNTLAKADYDDILLKSTLN